MKSKLLINGHWIYQDDGWHLAVYPIASCIHPHMPVQSSVQSFILSDRIEMNSKFTNMNSLDKFLSSKEPVSGQTLYNLGYVDNPDEATEFELYLVCPHADTAHTQVHPVIVDEGYMYVEDLGIDSDDDPLDVAIYEALERLEAPHVITCRG